MKTLHYDEDKKFFQIFFENFENWSLTMQKKLPTFFSKIFWEF